MKPTVRFTSLVLLSSHTASGVMMFRLTISIICDVGMMDSFVVCTLLFELLFHRYMVVMVLDPSVDA